MNCPFCKKIIYGKPSHCPGCGVRLAVLVRGFTRCSSPTCIICKIVPKNTNWYVSIPGARFKPVYFEHHSAALFFACYVGKVGPQVVMESI